MNKLFVLLIAFGMALFMTCVRQNPELESLQRKLDSIHKVDSIDKINKERQRVADSIAKIIELKLKNTLQRPNHK